MAGLAEWISENVLGVEPAPVAPVTSPFYTGAAPLGMTPTTAGPITVRPGERTLVPGWTPGARGVRGRTLTEVYTVFPDGTKQLKSVTPGGVKLYSRDVTAAKRTRKIGRLVNRLFPTRRRKSRKR